MAEKNPPLEIRGITMDAIRNKNEQRVATLLAQMLDEESGYTPDPLDIQDIYALSLNLLPSRYRQSGTIVLSEPVKDAHIISAIRRALRTVRERPNY